MNELRTLIKRIEQKNAVDILRRFVEPTLAFETISLLVKRKIRVLQPRACFCLIEQHRKLVVIHPIERTVQTIDRLCAGKVTRHGKILIAKSVSAEGMS